MRTLIDIGEAELKALDRMARSANVSRASLIRKAVNDFLGRERGNADDAFGLWGHEAVDDLEYQEKVRSEW